MLVFGAYAGCISTEAFAANCATVTFTPSAPSIANWNPINGLAQETGFTIRVTPVAANTRSARLIFLDADTANLPLKVQDFGPRYDIINTATSEILSFPRNTSVTSSTVQLLQFPKARTPANLSLRLRLPANQNPVEDYEGGRTYSETLRYAVQCFKINGDSNGIDQDVISGFTLSYTTPRLAQFNTAGPINLDFGNFTSPNQTARITIRSTSRISMSAVTANGGRMVRQGSNASPSENATIPYSILFNGRQVIPGQRLSGLERAGIAGANLPLVLQLNGIPSGKLAGSYSDTITLTIEPEP
jgi:spore coat protein U-like protein